MEKVLEKKLLRKRKGRREKDVLVNSFSISVLTSIEELRYRRTRLRKIINRLLESNQLTDSIENDCIQTTARWLDKIGTYRILDRIPRTVIWYLSNS